MAQGIFVDVGSDIESAMQQLARQQNVSLPNLARELIQEALECREDEAIAKVAKERESKSTHYVSHEEAWKDFV